jgi:7,8-dihydroneopterin aldolase/epimerase/oxygenase
LHNFCVIYNNNEKHLFYQKARQITCHFPHFLIKYALFSYYSKSHYAVMQRSWVIMDKIIIKGLKVATIVGVYEHEKHTKQNIVIDIVLFYPLKKSAISTDINDTLDYKKIADTITHFIQTNNFLLIETIAEQSAKLLLKKYKAKKVKICVHKPNIIKNVHDVMVKITRKQKQLNYE